VVKGRVKAAARAVSGGGRMIRRRSVPRNRVVVHPAREPWAKADMHRLRHMASSLRKLLAVLPAGGSVKVRAGTDRRQAPATVAGRHRDRVIRANPTKGRRVRDSGVRGATIPPLRTPALSPPRGDSDRTPGPCNPTAPQVARLGVLRERHLPS
jgi:hypothetical protein